MITTRTLGAMSRPYSKVAELETTTAENADWDVVEGFTLPYAPGVVLPVALQRQREYRFVWNPASQKWDAYSRASASQGVPDDD